jgi:hypothetical protein
MVKMSLFAMAALGMASVASAAPAYGPAFPDGTVAAEVAYHIGWKPPWYGGGYTWWGLPYRIVWGEYRGWYWGHSWRHWRRRGALHHGPTCRCR